MVYSSDYGLQTSYNYGDIVLSNLKPTSSCEESSSDPLMETGNPGCHRYTTLGWFLYGDFGYYMVVWSLPL